MLDQRRITVSYQIYFRASVWWMTPPLIETERSAKPASWIISGITLLKFSDVNAWSSYKEPKIRPAKCVGLPKSETRSLPPGFKTR